MTVPHETTDAADRSGERYAPTRRSFLAGVTTAMLGLTAGCSQLVNAIADRALGDVNLFNETERDLEGTIDVTGPDGEMLLSETFELAAQTGDEPTEGASTAHEDVWQGAGDHEVAVELAEGQSVRGESSASETVTIDAPDEDMLAVAFGAPDLEAGIYVTAGESLTDFHPSSS